MLEWKDMGIKAVELLLPYCSKYNDSISDYTFTSLLCWGEGMQIKYALYDGAVLLKYKYYDGLEYALMPLGYKDLGKIVTALQKYFELNNAELRFALLSRRVAEEIENIFPNRFNLKPIEEQFDYIYTTRNFIEAQGSCNRTNRAKINRILRRYKVEYKKYTREYKNDILKFHRNWAQKRVSSYKYSFFANAEMLGLEKIMDYYDLIPTRGGVLLLDGHFAGFGFGDRLNEKMCTLHNVKTTHDVNGSLFLFIRYFLANEYPDAEYMNFEDDMGLEGLRIAKKRLNFWGKIEKYGS
ncbi:MAG: DUF2156 domain-containing protein [Clostridiaceae bacterium]|nr:DUF2156 domain-containing protein [Clostridiaceae bacterium]